MSKSEKFFQQHTGFALEVVEETNMETGKEQRYEPVPAPIVVGTIFVSSWGWEQTNVSFYQVQAVRGGFVIVRELQTKRDPSKMYFAQQMCDYVIAEAGDFLENTVSIRKKVTFTNGKAMLRMKSYERAYVWDGEPKYRSWYA